MKELKYWTSKILSKLRKNHKESMSQYFRNTGMIIGKNCNICCNIMTSEPYLVQIGNNVTIAGNVTFITHDNSVSKIIEGTTDLFGKIIIGNNSFIGSNSTILYGVSLADNTIVAAGSVVTKSFSESNIIIAGNPAHKISGWEEYIEKNNNNAFNVNDLSEQKKRDLLQSSDKLISR